MKVIKSIVYFTNRPVLSGVLSSTSRSYHYHQLLKIRFVLPSINQETGILTIILYYH